MNKKTLNTLEFNKILELLSENAGSEPGKKMCLGLCPSSNPEWIESSLLQTECAVNRLLKNDRISFGANKDIRVILKQVEKGHTASAEEILMIAGTLSLTDELIHYAQKEREDEPDDALTNVFNELVSLAPLEKEIRRIIISEDEIADNASRDLADIRSKTVITSERIHSGLTNMVNSTYRTYLMDPVITMRNNRYCLPVKAEYKSSVPGIVHDQSSTGSTLFIEPQSTVELNNKLKELELKELQEIQRILSALSGKIAADSELINNNQRIITFLDFIFAKGKYALKLNASKPVYNEERRINLKSARHPLLDSDKVVPIDIRLGEDFDLLVITGPNTGGKTVSLKTCGLLCAMGQSGLFIPAKDSSELGVFKDIYADIGDEQSIEQSLSTFSAHMTGIVNILSVATDEHLCLFDELGAGTDPSEGAALAISILDYLHERGIRTIATTHYSELKVYALTTDFVENACCEFDVEKLAPTYRLLIGIPGKSNAFAISKKLGLFDEILEKAKQTISSEEESFEQIITDLEVSRSKLDKEMASLEAEKNELMKLKAEIEEKERRLSFNKDKLLQDAREEAKEILKEAKEIADDAIISFQKNSTHDIKSMEKKRTLIRETINKNDRPSDNKKPANSKKTLSAAEALPGTEVHIVSMNLDGTIKVRPDSKGNVLVQCGIISSKVNIKDLIPAAPQTQNEEKAKKSAKLNINKTANISQEINVLGMYVDDAIMTIDKYLDDAYLCHIPKVRIVHGKGTGALRSGIHNFLRGHHLVAGFELAAHGEGDAGVTVVTLK